MYDDENCIRRKYCGLYIVFVSIEFDVMVDVEFVDDDDDNVGDEVVIIDRIVFNGEQTACAWLTHAFDAIAFSVALDV